MFCYLSHVTRRGRRGRDRMVVGFITTYAISVYHYYRCEFESHSGEVYSHTTLSDKVCQSLAAGRWFYPVSSINKTDHHDITEMLLKVALNTINQHTIIRNIFDIVL